MKKKKKQKMVESVRFDERSKFEDEIETKNKIAD